MLKKVFAELDKWIAVQNDERGEAGLLKIPKCEIKVFGQTALVEAGLSIHVPATMDVDVFANYDHVVMKKFEELLKQNGKMLDPVGHEAWMPKETEYWKFFSGDWVTTYLAKVEYVMISKAKKALQRNKSLLTEYLASEPPPAFYELASKYEINLNIILE